jgi:uncharacterized protein (DUF1330 family)
MNIENKMDPTGEQIQALMEPGPDAPIYMVNLVKFKERAEYADGRETDLSGREAYMIYGRAVAELLPKFGGSLVFAADVTFLTLGVADELWDEVAIATYPDRAALVAMSMSQEWQEISVHRSAGLAGQLNIESVLQPNLPNSLVV